MKWRVRQRLAVTGAVVAAALMACTGKPSARAMEVRQWTNDMAFRISSDPVPPKALERIRYKVVVTDKESGQPIDGGEGRIFATSRDGASTHDGFAKGAEPGTYYANLFFVTAGDWVIGLEFRRDSTRTLERTQDWPQDVAPADEPGT